MRGSMMGFGRPYISGLGAFGSHGVDRVIRILSAEVIVADSPVDVAGAPETVRPLIGDGEGLVRRRGD